MRRSTRCCYTQDSRGTWPDNLFVGLRGFIVQELPELSPRDKQLRILEGKKMHAIASEDFETASHITQEIEELRGTARHGPLAGRHIEDPSPPSHRQGEGDEF